MAIIKFNTVDEFIDELKFDSEAYEPTLWRILRLTNLVRDTNTLPIRHLTVIATIKSLRSQEDIIRLERFCGQLWGFEHEDKPTYERAKAVFKLIEEACKPLNIEVRPGVLEEAK